MNWYQYVECFLAGLFLANAVPHFVKGVCGDRFPTPFAKPPGKGLSSPLVNVVWSLFNMAVGYFFCQIGKFSAANVGTLAPFFAGVIAISLFAGVQFEKKHST